MVILVHHFTADVMVAGLHTPRRCGFHVTISLHWLVLGLSVAMNTGNGRIPGPYVEVRMWACVCVFVCTCMCAIIATYAGIHIING